MSQSTIQAIRNAEEAAEQTEKQAAKQAAEILKNAKAQAAAAIEKAITDAQAHAALAVEQARLHGDSLQKEILQTADEEISRIKTAAEAHKEEVEKLILMQLV